MEKETGMEGVEYNRNKIIEHNKIEQKHISEQQYKIWTDMDVVIGFTVHHMQEPLEQTSEPSQHLFYDP